MFKGDELYRGQKRGNSLPLTNSPAGLYNETKSNLHSKSDSSKIALILTYTFYEKYKH